MTLDEHLNKMDRCADMLEQPAPLVVRSLVSSLRFAVTALRSQSCVGDGYADPGKVHRLETLKRTEASILSLLREELGTSNQGSVTTVTELTMKFLGECRKCHRSMFLVAVPEAEVIWLCPPCLDKVSGKAE